MGQVISIKQRVIDKLVKELVLFRMAKNFKESNKLNRRLQNEFKLTKTQVFVLVSVKHSDMTGQAMP